MFLKFLFKVTKHSLSYFCLETYLYIVFSRKNFKKCIIFFQLKCNLQQKLCLYSAKTSYSLNSVRNQLFKNRLCLAQVSRTCLNVRNSTRRKRNGTKQPRSTSAEADRQLCASIQNSLKLESTDILFFLNISKVC